MPPKKPPHADFARRLFTAAKRWELQTGLNLNREELAQSVDVSDSTVSNWFTGNQMPKVEQLEAIGKFLNASPAYLAFGEQYVITGPDGEPLSTPSPDAQAHRRQGKRGH
jgi:transcriptional regulator with XRE-family HTH domain